MAATAVRERSAVSGGAGVEIWDDALRGGQIAGTGYPMYVLEKRSDYWHSKNTKNVSDFFIRYRSRVDQPSARARRNVERILPLLASVGAELIPSDNSTYYVEWDTAVGFASLEIGTDQFGFSFLPNVGGGYGENGSLRDLSRLRQLIEAHS